MGKELTSKVLVKNASGTSVLNPPSPYSTWLEYWEAKSGNKLEDDKKYICPASDCNVTPTKSEMDGCHIQTVFDPAKKMYIVPLCSGCNHRNDWFFVDKNLLVPAP